MRSDVSRVLVTGATGFIGSHLARRLVQDGFQVGITKRPNSEVSRIDPILNRLSAYDLQLEDTLQVAAAVADFRPDAVFHLAAYYAADHQPSDIAHLTDTNVLGTINLLEACRASGVKRFLNTSSCFVYQASEQKLPEEAALQPVNLYALTKLQAEEACTFYAAKYGVKAATLRLFPPYGAADNPGKLIPYIIRSLLAGRAPEMTSGRQQWDFTFIDDIVDAYVKLLSLPPGDHTHEVFNIGTGTATSIRALARLVQGHLGTGIEPRWGSVPHRSNEVWFMAADTRKAQERLGWRPGVPLNEGLRRLVDACQRGDIRHEQ